MKTKAVIDRFEGDQTVLLVNEKPMVFRRKYLPAGLKEGDWLLIEVEGKRLVTAEYDEAETMKTKERIAEKLARLRRNEQRKKTD
jgi:hypothetical protein